MEMFFRVVGGTYLVDKVAAVPEGMKGLDGTLVAYLWSKLGEEYRYLMQDHQGSTLEAWKNILSHFTRSTMPRRIQARQDFYHVEHDPSEPIGVYIYNVTKRRQALVDLGCKVEDVEMLDVLLMNLHESFASVKTTILTQKDEPKLEEVKAILMGGAQSAMPSIKTEPSSAAFATQAGFRGGRGGSGYRGGAGSGYAGRNGSGRASSRPSSPRPAPSREDKGYRWCDPLNEGHCHRCGRSGHIAARCIHDMPQHVKEWVMNGPPHQPDSGHFAAEESAGLAYHEEGGDFITNLPPLLT